MLERNRRGVGQNVTLNIKKALYLAKPYKRNTKEPLNYNLKIKYKKKVKGFLKLILSLIKLID
jgi:hypothetical protein